MTDRAAPTARQFVAFAVVDVLVVEEPPLLAEDDVEVWVEEEFDPSAPEVVEEPVEVPV
jgi:hypothetical protein